MTRFILEVRKRDGSVYTPNTLHHITAGVMRHLRWNGRQDIDFFRASEYNNFRQSLDAEMKRLQSLGIGAKKKQAKVLTEAEEELLWTEGLLGGKTPRMLLDTVVFYNVLNRARQPSQTTQVQQQPAAASCAFTSQQQLRSLTLPSATFNDSTVNFVIGGATNSCSRSKRRRPFVIDDTDSDTD